MIANIDRFDEAWARAVDRSPDRPTIVGIDGRAGSGKTGFTSRITEHLSSLGVRGAIVRFDTFWRMGAFYCSRFGTWEQAGVGSPGDYEYDWRCCLDQLLIPIRGGRAAGPYASEVMFGFACDHPRPDGRLALIVEGCTTLRTELRPFYDLTIFVDLDQDHCTENLIRREGPGYADYFRNAWQPKEREYLRLHKPEESADLRVRSLPEENSYQVLNG